MIEVEVALPPALDSERVPAMAEEVCLRHGLALTLKDTLAAYAGGQHWHFGLAGQRGTLELTNWPARRRLWFKVAKTRQASWIDELLPTLAAALRSALEQAASTHTD